MSTISENGEIIASIIIPFRNARKTLGKLIDSLKRQTFKQKEKIEIIFVDDGSTDGSYEFVLKRSRELPYRVKILRQEPKGCYSARNLGIKNSKGKIIVFIDADEVAMPTWLENILKPFMEDPSVACVCGRVVTDENVAILPPVSLAPIDAVGRTDEGEFLFATCNIAYRRDVLEKVGLFDENFDPLLRGDTDLGLRVKKAGFKVVYNPDAVVYHPPKFPSFRKIIKLGLARSHDVLLYKKHKKEAIPSLGNKLFRPLIGPLSPIGLSIFGLIALIILLRILFNIAWLYILGLIALLVILWIPAFIVKFYKLVLVNNVKPPIRMRAKAAIYIPLYMLVIFVARVYGSIRYKCLLI